MEPNNPTSTSTSAPIETPAVPTPVAPGASASPNVVVSPKKPGMGKKSLIIVLVIIVILVILGALGGYYYYANMMNKVPEETAMVPSPQPQVTAVPTEPADMIKDDSELDQVVSDLDSATDEASMTKEVQGLQSDSNF